MLTTTCLASSLVATTRLVRFGSFGRPPYHCHPLSSQFLEASHTRSRQNVWLDLDRLAARLMIATPCLLNFSKSHIHTQGCTKVIQRGFKNNVFSQYFRTRWPAYFREASKTMFFSIFPPPRAWPIMGLSSTMVFSKIKVDIPIRTTFL